LSFTHVNQHLLFWALAVCRWISAFFLSELFNMCIIHGYIPNSCLNTTISPICKNKNGNMSDTSNYISVPVATVVSKLHEYFMLSSISPFVGTTDNQFGFRAGHSTVQCTFLLKQTASYFVTHGSSVRAVFLDDSKAFDRVPHIQLFEKLIQTKVPACFVRLMKHWNKEQTMQIKWGKHFSEAFFSFHVSNGVRQRGVLSPYLFAVYLDDLSNELNNIKARCYTGEVLLNHLMFADNICVFCPLVCWLQRILDVCQTYAESHRIILNCNKTVCMTIKAKNTKSTATPLLKLGGQYVKSVDQHKYQGIILDTELSDDKTFRDNCDINIVQ